jgi:hypothetical protein
MPREAASRDYRLQRPSGARTRRSGAFASSPRRATSTRSSFTTGTLHPLPPGSPALAGHLARAMLALVRAPQPSGA